MKKTHKLLLLLALVCTLSVCGIMSASAATQTVDGVEYTYELVYGSETNPTVTITGVKLNGTTDLVIPEKLSGTEVTEIGRYAVDDNTEIKSLTTSKMLTDIGAGAFSGCYNLEKVTFLGDIFVGQYAFRGCKNLSELVINSTGWAVNSLKDVNNIKKVTLNKDINSLTKIPAENIEEIIIGDTVKSDELSYNFADMTNLKTLVIGDSIKSISSDFNTCTALETLVIGDSVTKIGNGIFRHCKNLKNLTLGNELKYIGTFDFLDCEGLENVYASSLEYWLDVTFEGSPMDYAENLYFGDELVTEVVIPENITELKDGAFYGCENITSITLHNNITKIGNNSLRDCSGLTEIDLPDDLLALGNYALAGCKGVSEIKIPESVTLGERVFSGSGITSITIPDTIKTIPNGTFLVCKKLSDIIWHDNITEIGHYAFSGCENLVDVVLPKGLETIGNQGFRFCTNLKSIVLPEGLKSIGTLAFCDCDALETLILPASVTAIGEDIFDYKSKKVIHNILGEDVSYYKNIVHDLPVTVEKCNDESHIFGRIDSCEICAEWAKKLERREIHTFNSYVSNGDATCDNDGTKTASCEYCKKTETVQDVGSKLPHADNNHDGRCDRCSVDTTKGCGHLCHKGGFWYKFCLFFWKLFKIQRECSCGMYHY